MQARAVAAQRVGDLPGPLGPLARVFLQALEHDVLQLFPHVSPEGPRRLRHLVDDPVEDRLDLAGERRLPGEALVEDRPQRINVGTPVEGAGADLLGGKVGDGPDEGPGLRQPALRRRVGETEVHHADPDTPLLPRHHDVLGLDVAVNDTARVAVFQCVGGLDPDVEDLA